MAEDGQDQPRKQPRIVTVDDHTMGESLHRYLGIKMHQAIRRQRYDKIIVVGSYSREPPAEIFKALVSGDELQIHCFPGNDHVEHYAELIATFLELQRQDGDLALTPPSNVFFVPLSPKDTQLALRASNLGDLPHGIDVAVLGLVHRLKRLTSGDEWQGGDGCFAWKLKQFNEQKVAFIGCRPSFWGDVSGEIVRYLASFHSIREVLYFGKLGSVRKGVKPNRHLATGSRSYVDGNPVEWYNVLETSIKDLALDMTIFGNHVTLPSVLHETKDWLKSLPEDVDFVDPEVGMMAQAAVRNGIQFGYVHIVSDNIAEKYAEDLSNERELGVLKGRSRLCELVQEVIGHHLSRGGASEARIEVVSG